MRGVRTATNCSGLGMSALGPTTRPKPEKLRISKCFPVAPESGTYLPILELLPLPAFRERRHRGLPRRLVPVRRRAILMIAKGQRPHPRRTLRCRVHLENAADDSAIGEHVKSSSFHS